MQLPTIDTTHEAWFSALERALAETGAVLCAGIGSTERLLEVAGLLGEMIPPGIGMPNGAHDGFVYSVTVRNRGEGMVDDAGNTITSTTNRAFSLHTDGYNGSEPPRLVLLRRADSTEDPTETYLSQIDPAVDKLDARQLEILMAPNFPSSRGSVSVLVREGNSGTFHLRLNEVEIHQWNGVSGNPEMSVEVSEALDALVHSLDTHKTTLTIDPGWSLVLDNRRLCHGRSALAPSSGRVLQRVWVA